jgi:hypothetical protein
LKIRSADWALPAVDPKRLGGLSGQRTRF